MSKRYGAAIVSGIVAVALLGLVGVIYQAQAAADAAIDDRDE